MSCHNNSFNFWESKLINGNTPLYRASVAVLLLLTLIIMGGCSGGGAALDSLANDLDIIDLGEGNAMKDEPSEQKDIMPKIDQNVPAGLETATFALG